MHRKVLSIVLALLATISFVSAEENEDWYMDKPVTVIEFKGLNTVKKSELTGITSYFIDKPFTIDNYNELLNRLFALDYFEDITSYADHDPKDPDKVLLILNVIERPVIDSIKFVGNKKIRNGELRDQINTKVSDIFVEAQVLLDERAIRNHYLEKGYTSSSVTHSIEQSDDGGVQVTFNIDEGASTVIKEIHFSGNSIISERTLKNKITSKELGLFKDGAYQYSTLEQDKQRVIAYYREKGYADASIVDVKTETVLNKEKQRNEMTITFFIQEGAQYTYAGVRLSGNEVFASEDLLKNQKLKVGDIYNETKFQADLASMYAIYYENGYMTTEINPSPKKDVERKEISYDLNVTERGRSHVENIIIKGNKETKEYVIRREIPIVSGDVFSRAKVMAGLRNLMNLQYFSNVVPEPQQGSEQNLVNLIFTVEEQPTTTLQFGMTFSGITDPTEIPISLLLEFKKSNLFGEGKSLGVKTNIANTSQNFDISYSQNWIGNLPIYFSQSLSVNHSASQMLVKYIDPTMTMDPAVKYYSDYSNWSISSSSSLGRRWSFDYAVLSLSGGFSTSLNRNNYDESIYVPAEQNVSIYANRWGVSNSLFANFSVDARDFIYDPSTGWFASERLTMHGLIPKVEKEFFMRSETKLEGYLKLLDLPITDDWSLKFVLAEQLGVSMLFPFTKNIGDSRQLFIDGMFNGRGWNYNLDTPRGNVMFSNNLELRMPLVPGVVGVDFFFDTVTVLPELADVGKMSIDDFYFSYGPGLRFLMPQFPLHLLFTWKFKFEDGVPKFDEVPFQFVLSFNITNR